MISNNTQSIARLAALLIVIANFSYLPGGAQTTNPANTQGWENPGTNQLPQDRQTQLRAQLNDQSQGSNAPQTSSEQPAKHPDNGRHGLFNVQVHLPKFSFHPPEHHKIRKDRWIAYKLVNDPWLWQSAQADPSIVQNICDHAATARILAKYKHIDKVADADHYLCRRLTRWRGASLALVSNPNCGHVIALDPEGVYTAMSRDAKVARLLSKNIMFSQMVVENPDLGKEVQRHM